MRPYYDNTAREVLAIAAEAAKNMGQVTVGTEHILLGLDVYKRQVYGILVISCYMFYGDEKWGSLILALGVVTMFGGAVLAVFSVDLKRTLACSSMSQIGFILVGTGMQCLLGEENGLAVHGTCLLSLIHILEADKANFYYIMADLMLASNLALVYTNDFFTAYVFVAVSYTHIDVYKRQYQGRERPVL